MIHDTSNDSRILYVANRYEKLMRRVFCSAVCLSAGWNAGHSEIKKAQMKNVPTLCDSTSSCMMELFTAIQTDSIATVGT